MGIEPTSSAWKAEVLPLNYTRNSDGCRLAAGPLRSRAPPRLLNPKDATTAPAQPGTAPRGARPGPTGTGQPYLSRETPASSHPRHLPRDAWHLTLPRCAYARHWIHTQVPSTYQRCITKLWWRGEDSNLRRLSRQIYSLIPLTAREPLQIKSRRLSLRTPADVNP